MKPHKDLPRRLFKYEAGQGACVPFFVENPVEALPYFAWGFHDAAQHMALRFAEQKDFPDYEAPPMIYLYRHAAELYLKGIIWNGENVAKLMGRRVLGIPTLTQANHELKPLLPLVKDVMTVLGLGWPEQYGTYSGVEELMSELHDFDEHSFSFRYPMTKRGDPSKDVSFTFNVLIFAQDIEPVLEGLWDLSLAIDGMIEHLTPQ
jgi:hypothetical protein